eukprot:658244-Pyramimonas_sp.AAC.1
MAVSPRCFSVEAGEAWLPLVCFSTSQRLSAGSRVACRVYGLERSRMMENNHQIDTLSGSAGGCSSERASRGHMRSSG